MGSATEFLYARSPVWLQQVGVAAFGLVWRRRRFAGVYKEALEGFQARESFGPDEWQQWQALALRDLLLRCWDQVPHYRWAIESCGIDRPDIEAMTPSAFLELPLLEKHTIRQNPDDFIAKKASSRKLHIYHTSGSTGTPLAVRMSSETHQRVSAAYEARCRRWAGVDRAMSRAMIGGRLVVPRSQAGPPYWRYNPAERQLYLSAFHISPSTVADYVGVLNRRRPDYLVGYASAHYFLARFIDEAGLEVHQPRAILTSSEKLTEEMRDTLSHVYCCEVFDGYSGVEACCLISECEHHQLHVSGDVGLVEIVDDKGRQVPTGEDGEIVATGFLNLDQPLVRYRTGDIARWSPNSCECGRSMLVVDEIVGRIEDTLVGLDGQITVRIEPAKASGIRAIRECQVVQEALDFIRLRVVADRILTNGEKLTLISSVRERLGDVRVEVEELNSIERTSRGKFQAVVSKVHRE